MLETIGAQAKEAAFVLGKTATVKKNEALSAVADALVAKADTIIAANEIDVQHALEAGMKSSLVDRLKLTKERIEAMALGVKQVAELDDPIGGFLLG